VHLRLAERAGHPSGADDAGEADEVGPGRLGAGRHHPPQHHDREPGEQPGGQQRAADEHQAGNREQLGEGQAGEPRERCEQREDDRSGYAAEPGDSKHPALGSAAATLAVDVGAAQQGDEPVADDDDQQGSEQHGGEADDSLEEPTHTRYSPCHRPSAERRPAVMTMMPATRNPCDPAKPFGRNDQPKRRPGRDHQE
jgi:hypothetical protein